VSSKPLNLGLTPARSGSSMTFALRWPAFGIMWKILRVLPVLGYVLLSAAWAGSIEKQPAAKIYAAICSTCHGGAGTGGASWIDGERAPWIAGAGRILVKQFVRAGYGRSMPAFGKEEITDEELEDLAQFLGDHKEAVPAPAPPAGTAVRVDILDADPWYFDDGSDLSPDRRRVQLKPDQYLKVVNTGRTWHTLTNDELGKDSGLIGFDQYPDTGYYYADQKTNLAPGCVAYHCHLHPYMQVEVCTSGNRPAELTRMSKHPIPPPPVPGVGEIWADMQTQEEDAEDPVDGAMQVVDASTWKVAAYIPDVGNNPHSAWAGRLGDGRNIVVTASWHDNILTMIEADKKIVIANAATGAAPAHLQVSPTNPASWVLTHHGSDIGVELVDMDRMARGDYPVLSVVRPPPAALQAGAHGIWFCDDGDHFVTANSFSNSMSLYSLRANTQVGWAATDARFSLNPSVFNGGSGGCRRAYVTNFDSTSISIFDIDVKGETISRRRLEEPLADEAGNLALADTSANPMRWSRSPTQSVVSPMDATTHGRYLVVSNKASFGASVVQLDSEGIPQRIYNFPSGLGSHGVTFGRKSRCDSGNLADVCYYAYITNTFDDYLSVYDLEKVENGEIGGPGSAKEILRIEGALARKLAADLSLKPGAVASGELGAVVEVPVTVVCPDCRSGGHVGDVPVRLTTQGKYTYLKEEFWIDDQPLGGSMRGVLTLDIEANTNTGGFGVLTRPGSAPWR
jgi:mono/diheme cytochrome c family protein